MSGFLRISEGTFPLDDIAHLRRMPGKGEYYSAGRKSGAAAFSLWPYEFEELMARPVQIMPAEPGTRLITVYMDDEQPFADKVPLLAWAICRDGLIRPVTPAGVRRAYTGPAPWHPDYIELPNGGIYETGVEADPELLHGVDQVLAQEVRRHQRYKDEKTLFGEAQPETEEQPA